MYLFNMTSHAYWSGYCAFVTLSHRNSQLNSILEVFQQSSNKMLKLHM